MGQPVLAADSRAIHLPSSMPKGGRIMLKMPITIMIVVRGMTE